MVKMLCQLLETCLICIGISTGYTHSITYDTPCPSLANADNLSQTQLLTRITHGCRYDRLERPVQYTEMGERLPVDVYVRAYIYFMQNLEAHDLQFQIHVLLQLRYLDPRLTFRKVAPKRKQPILGEKQLRDTLWMPHIFLANERDSAILGTTEKDILTSISPDGTVIVSARIKATLYCWMNLQKFPFDEQKCSTILESWMYNTSELVLHWEQIRPITFDPACHLTEYVLQRAWPNETIINADLNDLRHGAFAGNYSSLSFTVHLTREVGFYIMDYFLPSILIVGISWVSFWLQADAAPPRIMLGTSTLLTFITLATAQGKTLPKVSYIKVSEVWFLGCTVFIFGSLLEFAFVNTIWRRKRNVDVKKINSKHILKSTLSPRLSRHRRTRSFSSMGVGRAGAENISTHFNNYLTVHSIPITTIHEGMPLEQRFQYQPNKTDNNNMPKFNATTTSTTNANIKRRSQQNEDIESATATVECGAADYGTGQPQHHHPHHHDRIGWTTLTPQEISMWIDCKARVLFPMAFLVFNIFFWTFVYVV